MGNRDMSGQTIMVVLATVVISIAVACLGVMWMPNEPGSAGRAGLVEKNADGSMGRTYLWVWPWENPDRVAQSSGESGKFVSAPTVR